MNIIIWIKNKLKSKDKPFFDNIACKKYYDLYEEPNRAENIVIYKVLREIRDTGRDLCSIEHNLLYTYQFKNGQYVEIDLKKTGRRKSAKKLFERMTSSIDEIKEFNNDINSIENENVILYTYFTNQGTYQDVYRLDEIPESGITAYVFSTFWNYVDLVDPNRQKRVQKMMRKKTAHNNV